MRRTVRLAALPVLASALVLAGCHKKTQAAASATGASAASEAAVIAPSDKSLTDALGSADGMSTLGKALKETGLGGIFGSRASYTVFAPTDQAFAKLGNSGSALIGNTNHAPLASLLKDHIVPGYIAPSDIAAAIDAKGGPVKLRTMGGTDITFAKSGNAIVATAPDGSKATLGTTPVAGKTSIAIPVDGVLKKV